MTGAVALVVNPTSGRGRGGHAGDAAGRRLVEAGLDVTTLIGRDVRESGDMAREAVEAGATSLVVVGGDGMVHLGIQAVAGRSIPFGVIPAGSGNDFARALGLPLDDPAAAADVVVGGRTRPVDLGITEGQWFAGIVAAGFDARVNDRTNRMRWPRGPRRYDLAVAVEFGLFRPIAYRLEIDGQSLELDAMLVAFGNIASYGGGIRILPDARPDDGLFDVIIVEPVSKLTLARVFPKMREGGHVGIPAVSFRQARHVKVDAPVVAYADGERLGPLPRSFDVAPGALTAFVP
jgi:diacylglycerol kinase (ATP)